MKRMSVRLLLAAVLAVFTLGSMAEAAPAKTTVHRRAKHSSRVSSGTTVQSKKKVHARTKKHRRTTTASTTHRTTTRRPSTKPR